MKYRGKILYTIDNEHPDIGCIKDWRVDKIFEFDDIYTFKDYSVSEDYVRDYIKNDLMLVAGGGYNTNHIHNVQFEIHKI